MTKAQPPRYDADSIKVLKGLDAVRKRPGMYIGDTDDGSGLHHMVYEAVDNAIDEALAGYCDTVVVSLHADGSASVRDNGRGIPVDIHLEEGISAAEVIMTQLHSGGKFDQNSYKVSGGLHGVGVSVVNALSSWLTLTIWRDGKEHFVRFVHGVAEAPLAMVGDAPVVGDAPMRGTEIHFLPSPETFTKTVFDFSTLERRLRELAFLNSGVRILLQDLRQDTDVVREFCFDGGLVAFLAHMDRSRQPLHTPCIAFKTEKDGMTVEVAMQWNDSWTENTLCFTNNIPQKDGGTHLAGLRASLTRVVNAYMASSGLIKKSKVDITGDDAREGLSCILSVKVPDPKFSSQTKDKLVSSEVRGVVEQVVNEELGRYFEEHPQDTKTILNKVIAAAAGREAARRSREISRNKTSLDPTSLPGKLAACSEKDPEKCEVFIVEGDSAGGSAKQARDRSVQAILPLRGKILNVERVHMEKMLSSAEIGTLIMALGTGIGAHFNADKCRYHKIIIMTDADVDGSHIRTLLLTFFYRQMPELIERGYVYIAQPPLYKTKRGSTEVYHKNQASLDDFLYGIAIDHGCIFTTHRGEQISGRDLSATIAQCREISTYIHTLAHHVPPHFLEYALLSGALNPHVLQDSVLLLSMADALAKRLNTTSDGIHHPWLVIIADDGGFNLSRDVRGVHQEHHVSARLLSSPDCMKLFAHRNFALDFFESIGSLTFKDGKTQPVSGLLDLLSQILELGKKGTALQRYKGLGEMNPEQLWETTLDVNARTLLQVNVHHIDEANEVFSTLMGDEVSPRRAFIQENALNVHHLDV